MSHDPVIALRFSAFAVAMQARTGGLDAIDVDDLRLRAERFLEDPDPFRRACLTFATQYGLHRYENVKLAELGAELERAVDLANMPAPPDLNRRDIHG